MKMPLQSGLLRRLAPRLLFAALVLGQASVIVSMLSSVSEIRSEGVVVRLRCEAIDPYDPMRGRYVVVTPGVRTVQASDMPSLRNLSRKELQGLSGSERYALFDPESGDQESIIVDLAADRPAEDRSTAPFLPVTVQQVEGSGADARILIRLPVFRYYLQEDLAPAADRLLRSRERTEAFRPVLLLEFGGNGDYLVKGILVDEQPIEEYLRKEMNER